MDYKKKFTNIAKKTFGMPILLYGRPSLNRLEKLSYIKKISLLYNTIHKIIPSYPIKYYIARVLKIIEEGTEQEIEIIRSAFLLMWPECNDDLKMFLSKIILLSKILDNNTCKEIISFANLTKIIEYRYWTCLDISESTFVLQSGIYPEFYADRKVTMKKIAAEGNYNIPSISTTDNKSRLCIITYTLDKDRFNSVQRVAMMISDGLKKYYDETYVITLDSFFVSSKDRNKINTISHFQYVFSERMSEDINALFGDGVTVIYPPNTSYHERFQYVINKIYSINPEIIIDITDEFSPISFLYSKDYLTYYIPLRVGASSSFFTHIDSSIQRYTEMNKRFHCFEKEVPVDWGNFPDSVPEKNVNYSREDFGVDRNSFLIITIGKCEQCCKDSFSQEIGQMLLCHKEMVWMIIGGKAPSYLHKNYSVLFDDRRIIERGFESELRSVCEIADILMRVNTTGGNGATVIAAYCGLPIAMTNYYCDPMHWLGTDFSSIADPHELMEYIVNLSENQELYERESKRSIKLASKVIDNETIWERFANTLNKIKESYERQS